MPAASVSPSSPPALMLPPMALSVPNITFDGPLDLLLHYVREHKIAIADIPIMQVTDYYLAYLRQSEALNLNLAGEFFLMAATLLELKSRALLPRPPRAEPPDEDGEDPRQALIQRLEDYARYRAFTDTLAEWEGDRRRLFFRGEMDYGDLYELPAAFGTLPSDALLRALHRLLAEAGAGDAPVTSVRPRQKLTLRLAMAALWRTVSAAGSAGLSLDACFARLLVRLELVMTFLALLELLRQGRLHAAQTETLGEIWLTAVIEERTGALP